MCVLLRSMNSRKGPQGTSSTAFSTSLRRVTTTQDDVTGSTSPTNRARGFARMQWTSTHRGARSLRKIPGLFPISPFFSGHESKPICRFVPSLFRHFKCLDRAGGYLLEHQRRTSILKTRLASTRKGLGPPNDRPFTAPVIESELK